MMKQAIIDIGSNSMRLTVYDTDGDSFKILFREKVMAGLAGYVEKRVLSAEGITCACNGLLDFKETLASLGIGNVAVFATASLRNIDNTEEAVAVIKAATGYAVEVISGEKEALYGYTGAMRDFRLDNGAFLDIGGASTEIALFAEGRPFHSVSFQIGSLNLYRKCVKKIIPGGGALKKIRGTIEREIDEKRLFDFSKQVPLVCVGGTSRAVLKIAQRLYDLPENCHTVTAAQLRTIADILCRGDKEAVDLILKLATDRVHTIIPGVMILQHIFDLFDAEEIIVSKYGVREGYLCQKVL